jgi:type VI secretion system protein ImpJ
MSALPCGPVAWSDGMLIEVQHFQQLERHLSHQTALRFQHTFNHVWGFYSLDLDEDGLGMGRLGLRQAKGVFQDGTAFSIPSHESIPSPLETSSAQAGDVVVLAVQLARSGSAEMAFGGVEQASRYRAVETYVPDASIGHETAGAPKQVLMETGALQTRLCWLNQLRTDEVGLAIARIAGRSASQVVILDDRFIPPLLNARAHKSLQSLLDELQSVLLVRLSRGRGVLALSSSGGLADLVELLLRQALSEYRMRLKQLDAFEPLPPVVLHQELMGLLGRLSILPGIEEELIDRTFVYAHDNLQSSFEPLAMMLRRALATVIDTPLVPLRFEDRGDQTSLCVLDKQWKLEKIIFAVSANLPSEQIRKYLPQQSKIGSVEQIQKLVDFQLPGARLVPLLNPPRLVPYYAQSVYFEIEAGDPYWVQIFSGAAMAIRIVGEFPGLRFEAWGLRAVKDA